MSSHPNPTLSEEEYLALDRAADFRSEYYRGQMFAMAGGSLRHGVIIANLTAALVSRLMTGSCYATSSDVRLRIPPDRFYTYPDVMVVCGKAEVSDDQNDTVLNPALICEVLSPSTELHDRVFKFVHYRDIGSLQEYVLVCQTDPRVEVYRRHSANSWIITQFEGLAATCRFESLNCRNSVSRNLQPGCLRRTLPHPLAYCHSPFIRLPLSHGPHKEAERCFRLPGRFYRRAWL